MVMDALRNVNGNDQREETVTHSLPASSTLAPAVLEKVVFEKEQEQEMDAEAELEMTSKFVAEEEQEVELRKRGKAALDASSYAVSEDEISGEDVKMFGEGENEDSSDDEEDEFSSKKKLNLAALVRRAGGVEESSTAAVIVKKIKKKHTCVWTKPAPRKGKKKAKPGNVSLAALKAPPQWEDAALVTPMPKLLERCDDSPDMTICLSKVYKAEKVDISEDRMSAGSIKGYRMVRATRGVTEGAWYFEIKAVHLGESGHTRLGWSTEKGDLQAPVGYDAYSYGYRDIDGDKYSKGIREKYGAEGYGEGDVIGLYINLPNGEMYAPAQSNVVLYKGQMYLCAPDEKHYSPKVVPGSCISFFKNGICQGIAYKDITGGRYYPAASMYTLPNQQNCEVKFNFGPDFECFPSDFGDCPVPKSMVEVPYHGYGNPVEPASMKEKGGSKMLQV